MAPRKMAAAADKPKTQRRPRRKKVEPATKGLPATELAESVPQAGLQLAEQIAADGGRALATYREPFGGHPVVLAALPIDQVEPTPFQRDVSEAHMKKLANAMERVDRYLDPLITVRKDGKYWTPNGNHRLHAMRLLGMKSIVALVLPEEDVAFQILALNTEKAHNLKERSLEVIRMYRGLVETRGGKETDYIHLFEEPVFATFGAAYEKRPRYSAGAYSPVVKRLEEFLDLPASEALAVREARADKLLTWDDAVSEVVEKLKARGLQSPYLKNYVVARVNYLRFKKGGTFDFDETIDKMIASTRKMDVEKVTKEDIGRVGGAPVEHEE